MLDASALSDDLRDNLQLGLAIELSVLPPYLYALWSIKPASEGASDAAIEAASSIRAVAYEEMLHAGLVGNILNALSSKPKVTAKLMKKYPGPLPGHTTDPKYAFSVQLGPLSGATVATFMLIERPEWIPPEDAANGWITIGQFYEAVRTQLKNLQPGAFGGGCQVPPGDNPGPGRMFQVDSLEKALHAIDTVVDQGEGHKPASADDPQAEIDDDHEVAHYYQFATIADRLEDGRINAARDLYPVIEDPDATKYSPGQQQANADFNTIYTALLDSLEATFKSGAPRAFGRPTDLMAQLEHAAAVLRNLGPVPGTNTVAGPTFEYLGGA